MKEQVVHDPAWCQQNLVEVVHLAALHLHAKNETFTFQDLVRVTRDFYRDNKLTESLIAGALNAASIEPDWNSGTLKLAA